jgi:hypothetical protein
LPVIFVLQGRYSKAIIRFGPRRYIKQRR